MYMSRVFVLKQHGVDCRPRRHDVTIVFCLQAPGWCSSRLWAVWGCCSISCPREQASCSSTGNTGRRGGSCTLPAPRAWSQVRYTQLNIGLICVFFASVMVKLNKDFQRILVRMNIYPRQYLGKTDWSVNYWLTSQEISWRKLVNFNYCLNYH